MKSGHYSHKFPTDGEHLISLSVLIKSLESLNEVEWTQLIKDLVEKKTIAFQTFGIPAGDEPISYSVGFMRSLNSQSCRLISRSLSKLIVVSTNSSAEQNEATKLANYIHLIRALHLTIDHEVLKAVMLNEKLPSSIRESAGMASALFGSIHYEFYWQEEIDYDKYPELMPPAVTALAKYSPTKALLLLSKWSKNKLDNIRPIQKALNKLIDISTTADAFEELANNLPKWALRLLLNNTEERSIREIFEHPYRKNISIRNSNINITFRSNIIDIKMNKRLNVMPGLYMNSLNDYDPDPYESEWQSYYTQRVKEYLYEDYGINKLIVKYLKPKSHFGGMPYLMQKIKFSENNERARIHLPLEMMFYRADRREHINIYPMFNASHFGMLRVMNNDMVELSNKNNFHSFRSWLDIIRNIKVDGQSLSICTQLNTIVEFILLDEASLQNLKIVQVVSKVDVNDLSKWLIENYNRGILVAELGTIMQAQKFIDRFFQRFKTKIQTIPYKVPVPVGMAFRADDPEWNELCKDALDDTLKKYNSELLSNSITNTVKEAQKLKFEYIIRKFGT